MKDAAVPGRSCSTFSITTGLFRWGAGGVEVDCREEIRVQRCSHKAELKHNRAGQEPGIRSGSSILRL